MKKISVAILIVSLSISSISSIAFGSHSYIFRLHSSDDLYLFGSSNIKILSIKMTTPDDGKVKISSQNTGSWTSNPYFQIDWEDNCKTGPADNQSWIPLTESEVHVGYDEKDYCDLFASISTDPHWEYDISLRIASCTGNIEFPKIRNHENHSSADIYFKKVG